jgi:hypothetical protein
MVEQNICEFLQTLSCLVGKDVEEYLMNNGREYDVVRIPFSISGNVKTVDLHDFIRLRDIYCHQMFLLRLQDILLSNGIFESELPS